jgi:hypothetical protein
MIYRSNLEAPDLTPHFKHLVSRPMPHSFGHDVPSDWGDKADDDPVFGLYKKCGMWTHDEAAILFNVAAAAWTFQGMWVDIGAHTGWTSKHINWATNGPVECIDPMLREGEFRRRFQQNTLFPLGGWAYGKTSADYFREVPPQNVRGFCIDGDHEPGKPLEDAIAAAKHIADDGVIIFHDFLGKPVREAVQYLMGLGFHCRVYKTPHMIGLCWRGDFVPPVHVPDPNLPDLEARCPDFDFTRCE